MVPVQLPSTSIVLGRDADVTAVEEAFAQGERVVSLVGPGGVGKTTLAAVMARRVPGPVVWLPLAAVERRGQVLPALLDVLEVSEGGMPPKLAARRALAAIEAPLVVVDNAEHLLDDVGELLDEFLFDLDTRFLITSRVRLGHPSERVMSVDPLPGPPPGEVVDVRGLRTYPATELFLQRATRLGVPWRPSGSDAPVVAEIVRQLDGLPLAIEMAAARTAHLTPAQILEQLSDRFSLLSTSFRGAPRRHHTLAECIDWTYGLLEESERAVLRSISVFSGAMTLRDAVAVSPFDAIETLDRLSALVDWNLVRASARDGEEMSYTLLASVSAFAWDRVTELGQAQALRGLHANHLAASLDAVGGVEPSPNAAAFAASRVADLRRALQHQAWPSDRRLRLAAACAVQWSSAGLTSEVGPIFESVRFGPGDHDLYLWARVVAGCAEFMISTRHQLEPSLFELAWSELCAADDGIGMLMLSMCSARLPVWRGAWLRDGCEAAVRQNETWAIARWGELPWAYLADIDEKVGERFAKAFFAARRTVGLPADEDLVLAIVWHNRVVAVPERDATHVEVLVKAFGRVTIGLLSADRGLLEEADRVTAPMVSWSEHALYTNRLAVAFRAALDGEPLDRSVVPIIEAFGPACPALLAFPLLRGLLAMGCFDATRRALDAWSVPGAVTVLAAHRAAQAVLAMHENRTAEAVNYCYSVLAELRSRTRVFAVEALEVLAVVEARTRSAERAARLLGAASAMRADTSYLYRFPDLQTWYDESVASIAAAIGERRWMEEFDAGRTAPWERTMEWAQRGRGQRGGRSVSGWGSLTPTERLVARQLAKGRSNAEIAAELLVRPTTVKTHVSSVLSKLGLRRRAEVASLLEETSDLDLERDFSSQRPR